MPVSTSPSVDTGSGASASVSVCVVSAGRPELADLLDSLSKQDVAPDEVLVLVDGDVDSANEFAAAHPGVDVGVFSGLTLGAARNRLVKRATGDLFVFLDDDSVAPPEFVANLIDLATASPGVGVFGGPNLTLTDVDRREALVGALLASRLVTGPFSRRFRESVGDRADLEGLVLCNLAVRRSSWQPFLESIREGEETEFLYRLANDGVGVLASDDLMVWHRRRRTGAGLFEQMRRYGRGRSEGGREAISAFAPVAVGSLGLLLAGFLLRARIGLLYGALLGAVGVMHGVRFGSWRAGGEAVVFTMAIHAAYPLGLVEGMVRAPHQGAGRVVWLNSSVSDSTS